MKQRESSMGLLFPGLFHPKEQLYIGPPSMSVVFARGGGLPEQEHLPPGLLPLHIHCGSLMENIHPLLGLFLISSL